MRPGQLTWRQRGALWFRLGIRIVLVALLLLLLGRFGPPLLSLFAPFIAALVVAVILNPLVRWCQRRLGLSRGLLTLVILLLLFGLIGGALVYLFYATVMELVSLAQNWSGLLDSMQAVLDQVEILSAHLWELVPPQLNQFLDTVSQELLDWLKSAVPNVINSMVSYTTNAAMGVPSFVVALVIFIMASYLLTADYPYLRTRLAQHMDEGLLRFCNQVRVTALGAFGGYLKAELLLSVGVFFILLVGFFFFYQPYGLLLAFLLAILDFIPIVGAGTVMVPWAVLDLFMGNYRHAIELMVIWGIIALFRRVGEPKAVGHQTGLPPVLSLVSIYVGMRLAGVLGMILGPVVVLVVINIGKSGVFDGVLADLSLAAGDISALLKGGSVPPEDEDNSKIV